MEQNAIQVRVGESFQVSLQSMLGSTNYGWVLTNLPEGIVLAGYEVTKTQGGIAPVNQIFQFGIMNTTSAEDQKAQLIFKMVCLSDFRKCVDEIEVDVLISNTAIEANNQARKVILYTNNSAVYNAAIPYGFPLTSEPLLKYGAPCDEALVKYGAPCDEALVKYGAPCDEALVKYGAPCDEALVKYGAPCDEEKIVLKYGYPDCPADDPLVKYGAPCDEQASPVKYGFSDCE